MRLSRRQFVAAAGTTSATIITAPYVHGAYAAGKLSIGFWDHWVPGANKEATDLVREWAEREKVEVQIDYITSQGNKLLLTSQAEAQAKTGHDILRLATWSPQGFAELLEPVDDVMEPVLKQTARRTTLSNISLRLMVDGSAFPHAKAASFSLPAPASIC